MKKLDKDSFNEWLWRVIRNASLWKKIVLYIVASIIIIGCILGVFLFLLAIVALFFREYIPLALVPWIYGIVYGLSAILVFVLVRTTLRFLSPTLERLLKRDTHRKQ